MGGIVRKSMCMIYKNKSSIGHWPIYKSFFFGTCENNLYIFLRQNKNRIREHLIRNYCYGCFRIHLKNKFFSVRKTQLLFS